MYKKLLVLIFLLSSFLIADFSLAKNNDGLALSITPPLIKNNVNPGQVWKSSIKLINNNAYDIKVFVQVADFEGGAEEGTVKFIYPDPESKNSNYLMSRWMVIDPGPITVSAFSTKEISYIVDVPEDATPGGHYAAILAGTKPGNSEGDGAKIGISTMLSSLILLNVNGDVDERGRIREFSIDKQVVQDANVDFTVRFENIGNVHIQPQGEIKVYDFWDQEKGKILINHAQETGNVLPGGIRKWSFNWTGERGLFQMGRYKAVLVLSYGQKGRETVDRTLYFWVLNYKVLGYVFGSIFFLVLFVTLMVKRSIKKAILRSQGMIGVQKPVSATSKSKNNVTTEQYAEIQKRGNKMIIFTVIIFMIFVVSVFFINNMMINEQESKDDVDGSGVTFSEKGVSKEQGAGEEDPDIMVVDIDDILNASSTIQSNEQTEKEVNKKEENDVVGDNQEEVLGKETGGDGDNIEDGTVNKNIMIRVLNGSGIAGVAGQASDLLKQEGFNNIYTGNAGDFNYRITLIKHKKETTKEAELIANFFNNIVKLELVNEQTDDVVVVVGKDFSVDQKEGE